MIVRLEKGLQRQRTGDEATATTRKIIFPDKMPVSSPRNSLSSKVFREKLSFRRV